MPNSKKRVPLPLQGGCQCGKVRYEVTMMPLTLYACHCTECQRQSSSGFGMSMPVERAGFRVIHGSPHEWTRSSASGRVVACVFCANCGTRLFHAPSRNPSIVNIKPGTLDDTSWLTPVGHLWAGSAQRWLELPQDAIVFEAQPADFTPLFDAWREQYLE
ncbi:MAG: GFA family protein [Chloroflexota bacterium]